MGLGWLYDAESEPRALFFLSMILVIVVVLGAGVAAAGYATEAMARRSCLFLGLQNVGAAVFYSLTLAVFTVQLNYHAYIDMLADVGQVLFLWAVIFRSYRLTIVFDVLAQQAASASAPPPPRLMITADTAVRRQTPPFDNQALGAPKTVNTGSVAAVDSFMAHDMPGPGSARSDNVPHGDDEVRSVVSNAESVHSEVLAAIASPFVSQPTVQPASAERLPWGPSERTRLLSTASLTSTLLGSSMDGGGESGKRLSNVWLLKRYVLCVSIWVAFAWAWNLVEQIDANETVLVDVKIALGVLSGVVYTAIFGYCLFILRSVDRKFTQSKELVIMALVCIMTRVAIIWKVSSRSSFDTFQAIPVYILLGSLTLYILVSSLYPAILVVRELTCLRAAGSYHFMQLYDSNEASPATSMRARRAPLFEARLRHHDVHTVASLSKKR
ncbi:uncharacterized protein AMSG_06214 [Thecamonas trahens ATCC 50062]|uniref:Uncharacterized protein n=1 Tax=Thecamonas trahens ATCC 50062 TaxID=461836 RepID=A0A0L0DC44_THETB|nr:hypothetical protein AMSG_06214 [Thecamonas trahens ATCC 50062]KNC49912.1 hypothetical protein AMSG_06214 [Thecamonas trahens ATCC 50062]|eukprot:XP_013757393.1 hypothetical protein AMSG_06214 [Thecamonas trahens ATCC 50062]